LKYYHQYPQAFEPEYLSQLQGQILACPYFAVNNLNRDFVGTKGFSVAFQRSHIADVEQRFPYFRKYLDLALKPECNAFYINPLLLKSNSRVDPHIDRSLRSYCKIIEPPAVVSVLYVAIPEDLEGGELVLRSSKRSVGKIVPKTGTLLFFQGDLTHSVNAVTSSAIRLSLVCEQYSLDESQLHQIPGCQIESRVTLSESLAKKNKRRN
jgi:hypothetical protein